MWFNPISYNILLFQPFKFHCCMLISKKDTIVKFCIFNFALVTSRGCVVYPPNWPFTTSKKTNLICFAKYLQNSENKNKS